MSCHLLTVKKFWLPVSHEIKSQSFALALKAKVKVAQSCLTLFDPMDCSPPGSSVHGDSPGNNTGGGNWFLF